MIMGNDIYPNDTGGVKTLYSFDTQDSVRDWESVGDRVMGGVSTGNVEHTASDAIRFYGNVSHRNNGGFCSIRSIRRKVDLSDYSGIIMRVRGDGKRYAFNLNTDYSIRAGSYRCKFDTSPGNGMILYFPFSEFRATSFGQEIDRAPSMDPGAIHSLGFLISDGQEGPFSLEIEWIKAILI